MALDKHDLELIERVISKNGDDVAISIARSFERLEGRIDSAEARIYSRLSDLEGKIEASRQDIVDELHETSGQNCIYNHDHAENEGKNCVWHD